MESRNFICFRNIALGLLLFLNSSVASSGAFTFTVKEMQSAAAGLGMDQKMKVSRELSGRCFVVIRTFEKNFEKIPTLDTNAIPLLVMSHKVAIQHEKENYFKSDQEIITIMERDVNGILGLYKNSVSFDYYKDDVINCVSWSNSVASDVINQLK